MAVLIGCLALHEKPTIAAALMLGWLFWFLFFLYLGI